MTPKEAIDFLISQNCLKWKGAELVSTEKLYRELGATIPLQVEVTLKEFIKLAEVPLKQMTNDGSSYYLNRSSKPAERIYKQIVKRVNFPVLVASTRLYYSQENIMKNTISNYFVKGIWEGFYEEMQDKLNKGELHDHVTKTLSEGENTYEKNM